MYHISDLKKFNRCPRIYLLDQQVELPPFRRFVRLDDEVTALAAQYLGAADCFVGERNDPPEKAMKALNEQEWLMKARFEYGGLRIKVPFLHRMPDRSYELYFLFIGLYPHMDDMQFYCDTVWVLEQLGIRLSRIRMIHLNADYVRGETLDLSQLFVLSDTFYSYKKNNPSVLIEDAIRANMKDVSAQIAKMNDAMRQPMEPAVRTSRCTMRQKCRHYNICFKEEADLPDNSILTLTGSSNDAYRMKSQGIEYLRDADCTGIDLSAMQYAQIKADRRGGLFCDRCALRGWFSDIRYPVTFLDFEWDCYAIPPYQGMKPYDRVLFEYSLHILQEDGTVEHKVFLSVHDERYRLAKQLLEDIPAAGTIVAYNADGAEMIRIEELANLFPDLQEKLLGLNRRMKDLQLPFVNGFVYDVRMRGSWTLKQIMSMMDEPGYHDLDIQQGMDAVMEWRHLDRDEPLANREQLIEELKAYCGMDSYAAMVVFNWLKDLAAEED